MAWISVYENVIGGKLRTLANTLSCSQNEALGMLISLWLWGINNADETGKIIGASKKDIGKVLILCTDERINIEEAVNALISTNWLEDRNGDIYFHDWDEWQKQWYKALSIRNKDKERKKREREAQTNVSDTQKSHKESEAETAKTDEKPARAEVYSEGFEEFWAEYPRKSGKGDAYKKYHARIKDGWSPEELKEAAHNYAEKVVKERTEQKYIKLAKTFLSETTPFTDFIKKQKEVVTKEVYSDDDPYKDWR